MTLFKKQVWAFWANRNGPWFKHPQKVGEDGWHRNGNAGVTKLGIEKIDDVYVCFASYDKKEVQRFIDGFNACRYLLASLVNSHSK